MTVELEDETQLTTTISAGIASYPRHGESVEALLHAADGAVYDAKLGGRNRVRLALPPGTREALNLGALPPRPPQPVPHADPGFVPLREVPKIDRPEPDAGNGALAPVPPAEVVEEPADPIDVSPNGAPADAPEPPAPPAPSRRLIPWYAGLLCMAAAAVGLLSSPDAIAESPGLFALLVASALGIDYVRISLFERANISPGSVPILALAAFFGPLGPLAAESLIAITRILRREATVKWAFDLGALGLAGAAAAVVFHAIPTDHRLALLGVGILAGLVYYVVNAPLLAVVMGLAEGKGPLAPWRERLAWLWPHYGFFGALAAAFVISEQDLGLSVFAVFGLPVLVVWMSQKQYLDRSRSSVDALRKSHAELELANQQLRALLDDNQALMRTMHRSYLSTITSLARTIEAKDPYTGGHTERVARLALALAAQLGFDEEQLQAVNVGALIHDIGKIGISDQVLLKPGKLDDEEFAEIRRHPEISSYIVADLELPPIVKQMVRSHHERYDGSGYPDALEGEEIPLAARILAVADALDAMTSDRPYRKAIPVAIAREEIEKAAGMQFCPLVVAALQTCFERDPAFWESLSAPEADEQQAAATAR
jgi:putative nucleotidyltransferase with HDIG domain